MPQINKFTIPIARGLRGAAAHSPRPTPVASQHLLRQTQQSTCEFSTTCRRENATPTDRIPSRTAKTTAKSATVQSQLPDFNLSGKTYVITGGGGGLGLTLAEAIVEAGGNGKSSSKRSLTP